MRISVLVSSISRSTWLIVAVGALTVSSQATAGGFQITEICAKCQGLRNAGAVATTSTASTVFFNPAGMTRLSGSHLEANLHVIIPKFKFDDENSTNAIGGVPIGKDNDDGGETAYVPSLFFTQEINERWAFGIGVNGPYGLLTEYSDNWIGRYNAVKSELISVNINPSIAYQLDEKFSIGFGFNAIYVDVELTNALDFGTLAFLAGVPGVTPSTPAFDGSQKLTGNDWGFGWNVGILYEHSPRTRFGIAFRPDIDTTLKGDSKIKGNDRLAQIDPAFGSRTLNAKADFTVPGTITFGFHHELTDRWAVMASAIWTHWSTFDELRVRLEEGLPDSVQPENWDNSMRWAIGTRYQLNDRWTLRAGFEFDESPVDNRDRTPRIPDQDRYWFAFGAGYELSDAFSFDFAYTYIYIPDYSIKDTEVTTGAAAGVPVGNTLDGQYEGNANIVSAQVTWKF